MQCRQWVLAGALAVFSWPLLAQVPDALQVRGLAASCAGCHGTTGQAQEGMESLAGASREELQRKLLDFKNGKKPATVMHQLAKGYTDAELVALASYFSALKKIGP